MILNLFIFISIAISCFSVFLCFKILDRIDLFIDMAPVDNSKKILNEDHPRDGGYIDSRFLDKKYKAWAPSKDDERILKGLEE